MGRHLHKKFSGGHSRRTSGLEMETPYATCLTDRKKLTSRNVERTAAAKRTRGHGRNGNLSNEDCEEKGLPPQGNRTNTVQLIGARIPREVEVPSAKHSAVPFWASIGKACSSSTTWKDKQGFVKAPGEGKTTREQRKCDGQKGTR